MIRLRAPKTSFYLQGDAANGRSCRPSPDRTITSASLKLFEVLKWRDVLAAVDRAIHRFGAISLTYSLLGTVRAPCPPPYLGGAKPGDVATLCRKAAAQLHA